MDKIIAIWDIKDHKITVLKRDLFNDAIKSLPDGRYINTTERIYSKYSGSQRNTIFGLAYSIIKQGFKELGWENVSDTFVQEWCKEKCLPEEYKEMLRKEHEDSCVNKLTGEVLEMPFRLTITKLTTAWANEYFENMQRKAAEDLSVQIPNPDASKKT